MASAFLVAARESLRLELERAAAIFRRESTEYQVRENAGAASRAVLGRRRAARAPRLAPLPLV